MDEKALILSSKYQEEEEEPQRSWSSLPPELLSVILSHLFAEDYSNFHAVCKTWQSISTPFRLFPPRLDIADSRSPWLMFLHGSDGICKFFSPIYNDTYQMEIPELLGADFRFSKYGWLLMSKDDGSVFFFNPLTKVRIELPERPERAEFMTMSFDSPPTSPDCMVVGVSYQDSFEGYIGVLKHGEDNWTIHEVESNIRFHISDTNPILYKGLYYCLGVAGNVGVIDFKDNECSWNVCTKTLHSKLRNSLCQSFLVENDGEVLGVFVSLKMVPVHVFKLDSSKNVWQPVKSLGDKMLFVSRGKSFSERATVRGMGDRIYFPSFQGKNGVFYSLATGKYHSIEGNFSSGNSLTMANLHHSTWIKPMWTTSNEESNGDN